MKKLFFLFTALAFTATMMASCEPINGGVTPEEPKDSIPAQLEPLKQSVPVTDNWVFDSKPSITIHIENPNAIAQAAAITVRIISDLKKNVVTIEQNEEIPANGSKDVVITTQEDLAPGFYRANCIVNNKGARNFILLLEKKKFLVRKIVMHFIMMWI